MNAARTGRSYGTNVMKCEISAYLLA
jgi:hypothetical protein